MCQINTKQNKNENLHKHQMNTSKKVKSVNEFMCEAGFIEKITTHSLMGFFWLQCNCHFVRM